jgi:lysophospholipase L1-like esterase
MVPVDQRLSDHLERMLSARHPERAFEVMNLGRAGVNSAWVANRLQANLLAYRPQLVIVWVGVNDLWNTLETESWAISDPWLRLQRLLLRSKVYRLLTVIRSTGANDDARERRGPPISGEQLAAVQKGLAFDLERMVRTSFALRIPILLMNYPVPYNVVNATIRTSGDGLGVPVVKTDVDLARAQRDGHPQAALLTFGAGPHPTGLLYRYVAESTLPHVEMLLRQAGVDLRRDDAGDPESDPDRRPGVTTDKRRLLPGSSP